MPAPAAAPVLLRVATRLPSLYALRRALNNIEDWLFGDDDAEPPSGLFNGGGDAFTGGGAGGKWHEDGKGPIARPQPLFYTVIDDQCGLVWSGIKPAWVTAYAGSEVYDGDPAPGRFTQPFWWRYSSSAWAAGTIASYEADAENSAANLPYGVTPDPPWSDGLPTPTATMADGNWSAAHMRMDPNTDMPLIGTTRKADFSSYDLRTADWVPCTPSVTYMLDQGEALVDESHQGEPPEEDEDDGFPLIPPPLLVWPPILRTPPVGRQPPRAREKQRKNDRVRRFLKMLDVASESAETVNCFYEALPKDVTDRWGKDRPSRGLLDQAGQYGIDGADWKLQALWHNWHKVDLDAAMTCVAINEVEDRLIGAVQRNLPRGASTAVGRAFNLSEYERKHREIQERLDKWREENAQNAAANHAANRR